ncbi:hypothetical protein PybrP1_009519 [[Pythium] brassicae (nom. inval.)]|nr:hypothetical protein PybrP1_009519 [[Pythium] brassicae (nom. inval.)]
MAPEASTMQKLAEDVAQIQNKVAEISAALENDLPTEEGMSYLQVKNHALLAYTKLELFFALLKLEAPERVRDHAVFKELVRYRTLLERVRPLDRKLKYQIDKMLKVAVSGGKDMDESLNYAPNPDQLVGQDGQADSDDDSGRPGAASKDGIYRAPRLASVPYDEEEKEAAKKAKREERNRKRMQKSTILSELREEFSERPTEIFAGGSSAVDKELAREEAEKKDYEESRFVRLVTSRKDKIRKRQREQEANRADNVGSVDNFAGVQDILSLDKSKHRIPVSREPMKIGGKTGGIFAHIDTPTEKKRKMTRTGSNGAGAAPRSAPSESVGASTSSSTSKATNGKQPRKRSAPTSSTDNTVASSSSTNSLMIARNSGVLQSGGGAPVFLQKTYDMIESSPPADEIVLSAADDETKNWWEFYHEKFVRGREELMAQIRRKTYSEPTSPEREEVETLKASVESLQGQVAELMGQLTDLTSLVRTILQEKTAAEAAVAPPTLVATAAPARTQELPALKRAKPTPTPTPTPPPATFLSASAPPMVYPPPSAAALSQPNFSQLDTMPKASLKPSEMSLLEWTEAYGMDYFISEGRSLNLFADDDALSYE